MVDPRVRPPKAAVELADVVRRLGPEYTSRYGRPRMMPSQKKRHFRTSPPAARQSWGDGSTAATTATTRSGTTTAARNRACPECHGTQARQWLEERQAELLPCRYFHAVVTVPSQLAPVFRRNQKLLYGMLMQVSAAAVKDLCAEKRHLGALPGMLSVLHTWNGQLGYHPHVHLLITGGGITPDGQHWEPAQQSSSCRSMPFPARSPRSFSRP